jgi:DNA-binding transcriptional LysR family regulator
VSLAVLPLVAAQVLPEAIQKFRRRYPGVTVQVSDVPAERLLESVKKEEVDFGIGTCSRADRELRATPLIVDSLCAFVRRAHLLARQDSVTLRELVTQPLILIGKGTSVREVLDDALQREKLLPKVAYEANYVSTALGMVRADLGITVLPESVAHIEDAGGIRCLPITRPTLSRKIEIIQRKDRSLSPAAEQMLEVLREHAASVVE